MPRSIKRVKLQQTFWNPETKRFAPKDNQGRFRDYGFTFLNNETIYYGLASATQARDILTWTGGYRVVNGDTSEGSDIYRWRFGPRATTKRNIEYYAYVWTSPGSINFGDQVQDGGAVLGFTDHDLMARIHHINPDNAWQRLREILTWYDEVEAAGGPRAYYTVPGRGTLQGGGPAGGLGIEHEFYESVLAPAIILDGFDLMPRLPTSVQSLGHRSIQGLDHLPREIRESGCAAARACARRCMDRHIPLACGCGTTDGGNRLRPTRFLTAAGPLHELRLVNKTSG